MNVTAPANSIELKAKNIRGVEFQRLSNGNPAEDKMQAIQAAMVGAAVAINGAAGYLKQHFYPDTCTDLETLAAILTKSAEALQPHIEEAAQARELKHANPGETWDSASKVVSQLNAANRDFWKKRGAK